MAETTVHAASDPSPAPPAAPNQPGVGGVGGATVPVGPHHYDKNGLTREGMEAVIRSGGSVLRYTNSGTDAEGSAQVVPQLITQPAHLPTPAQLAAQSGNKTDMQKVLNENAEMRRRLDEQDKLLRETMKNPPPQAQGHQQPPAGASPVPPAPAQSPAQPRR